MNLCLFVPRWALICVICNAAPFIATFSTNLCWFLVNLCLFVPRWELICAMFFSVFVPGRTLFSSYPKIPACATVPNLSFPSRFRPPGLLFIPNTFKFKVNGTKIKWNCTPKGSVNPKSCDKNALFFHQLDLISARFAPQNFESLWFSAGPTKVVSTLLPSTPLERATRRD